MKNKIRFFLFIACVVSGGCMLGYSVFYNQAYQRESRVQIQKYENDVNEKSSQEIESILERAQEYNQSLIQVQAVLTDPFYSENKMQHAGMDGSILDINGTGQIGYLIIPAIQVECPVYEGTDNEVLAKGAGHLEGTSMPVGGEGTHAVIAGHTGLDDARLFTDLEDLQEGDFFYLYVLDQTLVYRVSRIKTVLPEETDAFAILEGEDLCTLVTCTPYGVNTHRLLVTGERTYEEENENQQRASQEMREKPNVILAKMNLGKIIACLAGIGLPVLCICGRMKKQKRRG